jgi:hypothetical protein
MPRLIGWVLIGTLLALPCPRALGQLGLSGQHVDARTVALVLARHEQPPTDHPHGRGPFAGPSVGVLVDEEDVSEPVYRSPLQRSWDCVVDETRVNVWRFGQDLRQLYTGENLCYLGLAAAVTAPLAFTRIDRDFSDWYQTHLRSKGTDDWARVGYALGQHKYTVPIGLGVMAAGMYWHDTPAGEAAYTWGNRTIRALAVGAPAVGVGQYGLGGNRPSEGGSAWHPFRDNNTVAGHGFIGAVPFLAAASMTARPVLKTAFFAGSLWAPWARLNNDAHFLSQCILGWSIAYLSVRSVTQTDHAERWIHFVPIEEANGVGMALCFRY